MQPSGERISHRRKITHRTVHALHAALRLIRPRPHPRRAGSTPLSRLIMGQVGWKGSFKRRAEPLAPCPVPSTSTETQELLSQKGAQVGAQRGEGAGEGQARVGKGWGPGSLQSTEQRAAHSHAPCSPVMAGAGPSRRSGCVHPRKLPDLPVKLSKGE